MGLCEVNQTLLPLAGRRVSLISRVYIGNAIDTVQFKLSYILLTPLDDRPVIQRIFNRCMSAWAIPSGF
jgi:hypothetical protein